MLVAIASTDGVTVNEHFGRAGRFLIYDVSPGRRTLIAIREVEPLSTGDKDHQFDPQRMAGVIGTVEDCRRVCCAQIGIRPRRELEKSGIEVMDGTRPIGSLCEE